MAKWLVLCALAMIACGSVRAAPGKDTAAPDGAGSSALTLSFPDAGSYSYWIQSKNGTVSLLPRSVSGHAGVKLPKWIALGDTLFILDAHSGDVATEPIAGPQSVVLTVSDFHDLSAPAPAAAADSAAKPEEPQQQSTLITGILQLLRWLFAIAITAGVVWIIWRLYQTRFSPLISIARKLGIDVPDPSVLVAEPDRPMPEYVAPVRRPEAIPETAGLAPPSRPMRIDPGPAFGAAGKPQLVAVQGIAAGSVFEVPVGVTQIGRDSDNGIVLPETTVSRHHARVMRDPEGAVSVADQESANGVYVNGARVSQATLTPGDEVKIGDNYFRYRA